MKKKFVSLLLAAALVFSLGVPAFAEGAEALPAEPEAAVAEAEPETSLWTVDLLHPKACAAPRTVAWCATMYSPSWTARCSGSPFMTNASRPELLTRKYAARGGNMSAGA